MKGHALFATCSFISARMLSAFVAPSLLLQLQQQQQIQSTSRASSHHSRNGRTPLASQLIVTVDAPRPALPPGKRMIRKRKAPPSPAPVSDAEIRNAPVEVIRSESEYIAILKENEQSLVVIKFFATWCRSCKSMDLKYRRLALEHENVKFYEVDVLESPELKKAMAVKAVPTVKLHAGSLGEVASFACGPKKVPELECKIEFCKDVSALQTRVLRDSGTVDMLAGQMKISCSGALGHMHFQKRYL